MARISMLILILLLSFTYSALAIRFPIYHGISPSDAPSPVNIVSKSAQVVNETSPLLIGIGILQLIYLLNTGEGIAGGPLLRPPFFVAGGIFGEDVFFHGYGHFFLNQTGGTAAHSIDGQGVPLELQVYYYNSKYGSLRNALGHDDGVIVLIRRVHVGPVPNLLFLPLQIGFLLGLIKIPGSLVGLPSLIASGWYDNAISAKGYFVYPGSFTDPLSKKTYFATYIIPDPDEIFISYGQFEVFKDSVLDANGKLTDNAEPQSPKGAKPQYFVRGDVQFKFPLI